MLRSTNFSQNNYLIVCKLNRWLSKCAWMCINVPRSSLLLNNINKYLYISLVFMVFLMTLLKELSIWSATKRIQTTSCHINNLGYFLILVRFRTKLLNIQMFKAISLKQKYIKSIYCIKLIWILIFIHSGIFWDQVL